MRNWNKLLMCSLITLKSFGFLQAQTTNEATVAIEGNVVVTSEINLTNKTGATIDVKTGGELDLQGDLYNNGTVNFGDGELTLSSAGTINGDLTIAMLNIDANINVNNTITVTNALNLLSGQLNVSGGDMIIASDATRTAYIDDFSGGNSGTINGNITVQRYVSGSGLNFYYVGSAVASTNEVNDLGGEISLATLNGATDGTPITPTSTTSSCSTTQVAAGSPYGGAFEYDESIASDCIMSGWVVRSSGNLGVAQGLAARINGGTTIDFTGTYQTGNTTSYSLSGTGNNTAAPGFNLVANPFASAIQWSTVAAANSGSITGTAMIWQNSGGYSGTYQSYNSVVTTNIASQQGFFVVATSNGATINFPQSSRTTSNPVFYKQGSPVYDSRLDLTVTGNGFADITYIATSSNFTDDFDNNFDARKLRSREGQPTIYTHTNPAVGRQAINAIPADQGITKVPVGFLPGTNGNFNFSAEGVSSFPANIRLLLFDAHTGVVVDLRQQPEYHFTAQTTDAADRFMVVLMKELPGETLVSVNDMGHQAWKLSPNPVNNRLIVELGTEHSFKQLTVIDYTGKEIVWHNLHPTQSVYQFDVSQLSSGIYLVRLESNTGYVVQKLLKK